jgi:hypothetical protein
MKRRSPPGVGALLRVHGKIPRTEEENARGQVSLGQARKGFGLAYPNRRRAAKRRRMEIVNAKRNARRIKPYRNCSRSPRRRSATPCWPLSDCAKSRVPWLEVPCEWPTNWSTTLRWPIRSFPRPAAGPLHLGGQPSFASYVGASIVSANILILARHLM